MKKRIFRWYVLLPLVLVVSAWIGLFSYELISGARLAQTGQGEIEKAKQLSDASSVTKELPVPYLRQAEQDFAAAESRFGNWSLKPLGILPVVGRQLHSLQGLSRSSAQVSRIGISAVTQAHSILGQPHGAGPARIDTLQQLIALDHRTLGELGRLNLGPGNALIGPIQSRREKFTNELNRLKTSLSHASDVATAMTRILSGPSTYLVLVANNGEMRAGSGSFLEIGTVSAQGGYMTLGTLSPSLDQTLTGNGVPANGDLAARWGWLQPGKYWVNLGLSPNFPENAQLAAQMWQSQTGQPVDGVMTLDIDAIRDLIQASGPISMPDGQVMGADQVIQFLIHDQYAGLQSADQAGAAQAAREDLLGYLAKSAFNQLQDSSVNLSGLSGSLADSTTSRHIMVWSSDAGSESAWSETGSGGTTSGSSILASVINRGGNKLDQYLDETETLTISHDSNGSGAGRGLPTARLEVTLDNQTPLGQSGYIAGPYPGLGTSYGQYVGLLALYLPGISSDARMVDPQTSVTAGKDGPSHLIAEPVSLLPGQKQEYVASFRLPYMHGSLHVVPSARIPSDIWVYKNKQYQGNFPVTLNW